MDYGALMNMRISRSIPMLLVAVATLSACEKNAVGVLDDPAAGNGANVKFFNFSVGSPQVNFYVNDKKVTAISATGCYLLDDTNRQQCLSGGLESASGVAYGSAGNGASAWYSDVAAGQVTVTGKIAATTDKNLAIANLQTNVEARKFYSYYLSGIYNTTAKTSDAFIVEDVMPPEDFAVAYVRFVNASSTTQPMTLYVTNRTTSAESAVGAAVAYKAGGAFVAVPAGSYDLNTRAAGSASNVFSRTQ
ncbi:MAG: hypothetical protein ACRENP_17690, partial [Longimicrobiales bacterium]